MGKKVAVTGANGLVGYRIVQLLAERDRARNGGSDVTVLALDVNTSRFSDNDIHSGIKCKKVDITDKHQVTACLKDEDVECIIHSAALVGPYHHRDAMYSVNVIGTKNLLEACRELGIGKFVLVSTPSAHMHGGDITGQNEDDLPQPQIYVQPYAETKAEAERLVLAANGDSLLTVALSPHQVYGPDDTLFFPAMIDAAESGRLRIIGNGENIIDFTHTDNIASACITASEKLAPGAAICGQFYFITDGEPQKLWQVIDRVLTGLGYPSLYNKFKCPWVLALAGGYAANVAGFLLSKQFKLNPFTVKMLTIHRWFNIDKARRELGYVPKVKFEEGLKATIEALRAKRGSAATVPASSQ
eukprot:GILK01006823.1.p1 GENE.GILK01006823.1~~GILK01006823.1.p1  ORF type:complete len:358 (+),score=52.07 GILK01006823.1:71-1144(+)